MGIQRRQFLQFLGALAGATAVKSLPFGRINAANSPQLGFNPILGVMPLNNDGLSAAQQMQTYSEYVVQDDIVLPDGFTYDVIAAWGDPVGDSHFGYNNDYLSFIPTGENEGYLVVNFEYISGKPWLDTYAQVIDENLPIAELQSLVESEIDTQTIPSGVRRNHIRTISRAALIDQGIGVISLGQENGRWIRTYSKADRRITGISGLEDDRYLNSTGPAVTVFDQHQLGSRIIGTFANCAGGTTPWGTVLSAEENFQSQVPEAVYADGSSFPPGDRPFNVKSLDGQGNIFALQGNKYGWIVEVDPANPDDYGTKHTWLGRFRHEAVGVRVAEGKPLAFYSGCDRRGGHIYKFVSQNTVDNPQDKANSKLLEQGMLYGAKFYADGTGEWLALKADATVNPALPSGIVGNLITLPQRPNGGFFSATTDQQVQQFRQQYATLGDLYQGDDTQKQGAILIDAHFAANAIGVTPTARPEDTVIAPDGSLYIAFTSGSPGDDEGGPDAEIFQGPNGETPYEYGWIMHLVEDNNDPAAMTFTWSMMATGGYPHQGGLGFANPDNLMVDKGGNLWMVTDMSTSNQNQPDSELGAFGNNSMWFMPTDSNSQGEAFLFAYGPPECEMTGPYFSPDEQTLFISIQHPGEVNSIRQNNASVTLPFTLTASDGQQFTQSREIPVGSNWPSKQANQPPKPAVVAIRQISNT